MTTLFILARAVHIGACLLFFAILAFDCFIAGAAPLPGETAVYWRSCVRSSNLILPPIIFISGIAWFVFVAMNMSGEPLRFGIAKTVWTHTQFGAISRIRLVLWFAAIVVAVSYFFRSRLAAPKSLILLIRIQLILSGCLLGSLAWAGHGRESSPWHVLADIFHLLAAGLWPAGLLPFGLLLNKLRHTSDPRGRSALAALVRRFSAVSLGTVALLAATGIVNGCFLVGSFSKLFSQPYGRWLVTKVALFSVAVAIGAVNLLRLKPCLVGQGMPGCSTRVAAQLELNVWLELILGTIIILIVAVLGILPP